MTTYINTKGVHGVETVSESPTYKQARKDCAEYNTSGYDYYYLSSRSTKEWREQE